MKRSRTWSVVAIVVVGLSLSACMKWKPSWNPSDLSDPDPVAVSSSAIEAAKSLSREAHDAETLQEAIDAWEAIRRADPSDSMALAAIADHSILMATAYTTRTTEKRALYETARAYSELGMYANPEFKALADQGLRPWEACHVLGPDEMQAMLGWMTAVLYNFKECMSGVARVFNIRWISRIDPMLNRMEEIDANWQDGAIPFNRGFYYFVLPGSLGGDKKQAAVEFARAVETGPDRLVFRWGRARFFRVVTKDREGFREDLEWVIEQGQRPTADPPPWAAYVREDARLLLEEIDRYF